MDQMSSRPETAHQCRLPCLLLFALGLAVPASLLTKASFSPLDIKLTLTHEAAAGTVTLAVREPLYVEYGSTVRAPDGARPHTTVSWNGVRLADMPVHRLFVADHGRVLVPVDVIRSGDNKLSVTVTGPPGTTFEFQARVHNYYGIAPDFPRVYVVADEAVRHARAELSPAGRAVRWIVFYGISFVIVWIVATTVRRPRPRARWLVLMAAPAALPWAVAIAGFASPLHIWLSPEAVLVAVVGGLSIAALAVWLADHRRPVLRVAAVIIVNLAVLEVGLRAVNAVLPIFLFYTESYNRYRGQPGAPFYDTHFNASGFNDVAHERSRPPGVVRRIVAIGDSFVVGVVPYRANYLTLVERDLSVEAPTEIIKLGIAATGPADYLAMLMNEGLAFGPDLVMAHVFVGNDLEEPGRRLHEYSYTLTLARALWRLRGGGPATVAATAGGPASYDDNQPTFARDRFLEIEVDRSWIYADAPRVNSAVAHAVDRLREMRDASRRAGAAFCVVIIPDEAQVQRDLQREVRRAAGDGTQLDFESPNRALTGALTAEGIAVLDLLPAFERSGSNTVLYKPLDTHWNLAGNRIAADTITAYLRATFPNLGGGGRR